MIGEKDMTEKEKMENHMIEGKRNLIQGLLREYDIQSAEDIQNVKKVVACARILCYNTGG